MKPVLLCFALLLSAFIPQSPEESPELNEATALTESVVKPRLRRISGFVVVKVTVDENGRVISARDMCQAFQ